MEEAKATVPAKEKNRRCIFSEFVMYGVRYAFAFSIVIFVLYTAGSMPDPGFSDRLLFFLLRVLRYSSVISCAFSLFAMGFSVHRMVYKPSLRSLLKILVYFLTGIISAGFSMLDTLIIAASEGNV
jgi:hypothetical protein